MPSSGPPSGCWRARSRKPSSRWCSSCPRWCFPRCCWAASCSPATRCRTCCTRSRTGYRCRTPSTRSTRCPATVRMPPTSGASCSSSRPSRSARWRWGRSPCGGARRRVGGSSSCLGGLSLSKPAELVEAVRSARDLGKLDWSRRARPALWAQGAGQVGVGEGAVGVEPVPKGDEVGVVGVKLAERRRAEGVDLAPVRPPTELPHDALHRRKVLAVVLPPIPVHRDVAGLSAIGGGHPQVVCRRCPYLDRERDLPATTADQLADVAQRLGNGGPREC